MCVVTCARPGAGSTQGTTPRATGPAPRQLTPPSDDNIAIVCAAVADLIRRGTAFIGQHIVPQMQRSAEELLQTRSRERVPVSPPYCCFSTYPYSGLIS
jgi:hypothetical protein